MARAKGLLNIAGNFEPQVAAPFDARDKVATKADLLLAETWQANDGSLYVYKGLKTVVTDDPDPANNGLYWLKDNDYTVEANWQLMGGAANIGIGTELPAYSTQEVLTTERWIDGRPIYKKTINTGAMPNTGTNTKYINIDSIFAIADDGNIWVDPSGSMAWSSTSGATLTLPRVHHSTGNILVQPNRGPGLGLQITTGMDLSAFDSSYVTLKYVKNTDTALSPVASVTPVVEIKTGQWTDSGKRLNGKKIEQYWIDDFGALPNATYKPYPFVFDTANYDYQIGYCKADKPNEQSYNIPGNGVNVYCYYPDNTVRIFTTGSWTTYNGYITVERIPK